MKRTNDVGAHLLSAVWVATMSLCGAVCGFGQVFAQDAPVSTAHSEDASTAPSKLDYVLLASLADASSLLSLSAYRTPAVAAEEPKKASVMLTQEDGE